jgi:ribonuclease P protein component
MSDASERFAKSDRILARSSFKRVYEHGRKYQSKYFTAFVLANPVGGSRIGITATRRIGGSVERNRARRLIREAFRKNKKTAPAGLEIVFNVKATMVGAEYRMFEADFVAFLRRLDTR